MNSPSSGRTSDYFQAVPAVVRALTVLERLAVEPGGLTLTALSRAVGINPSSLLAIANTLTARGYLHREPDTGRYRLGLQLATLAKAAGAPFDLHREFEHVAGSLVDAVGETVLLWALDNAETVLVAAFEGQHDLRLAPRPGTRRPANATQAGWILLAALADKHPGPDVPWLDEIRTSGFARGTDPIDPDLGFVVAPVLGADRQTIAAIGVGGPATRVLGERATAIVGAVQRAAAELSARLGCPEYRPYQTFGLSHPSTLKLHADNWADYAGGLSADERDRFLAGGHLARIACVKPDGYPYTVPAWYEWDGSAFWVVPRAYAEWATYLQRNPRVSMAIDEPELPLRRVLVEGRAEVIEAPCSDGRWREVLTRIAPRYLGAEADSYLDVVKSQQHWLFRIVPEKLRTWRGLTPHPRYQRRAEENPPHYRAMQSQP